MCSLFKSMCLQFVGAGLLLLRLLMLPGCGGLIAFVWVFCCLLDVVVMLWVCMCDCWVVCRLVIFPSDYGFGFGWVFVGVFLVSLYLFV